MSEQTQVVYVLVDNEGRVYAVVSDRDIADEFIGWDDSFLLAEVEVEDYTLVNEILDEVEDAY